MSRRGEEAAPNDPKSSDGEERAPYLGSWTLLYAAVLLNLAVLIALFSWFTRAFE